MIRVRFLSLILAACCLLGLGISAAAAEVDCDAVYCFTGQEFSQEEEPLACRKQVPVLSCWAAGYCVPGIY